MSAQIDDQIDDLPHPKSPCIGICSLDDADLCIGCRRSSAEIAAWSQMSAAEQWAVIEDLDRRPREG
jgi:hypothetical protein